MADQEFYEIMKQKIEAVNTSSEIDLKKQSDLSMRKRAYSEKYSSTKFHKPPERQMPPKSFSSTSSSNLSERSPRHVTPSETHYTAKTVSFNTNSIPTGSEGPYAPPSGQYRPIEGSSEVPMMPNPGPSPQVHHHPHPSQMGSSNPAHSQGSYAPQSNTHSYSNMPQGNGPKKAGTHHPTAVKHYSSRPPTPSVSILPNKNPIPDKTKQYQNQSTNHSATTVSAPNLVAFSTAQFGLVGFGMLVLMCTSFFLGRWSTSPESPTKNSVESVKKLPVGLDDSEKKYTIRVVSMPRVPYDIGRLNLKRAINVKKLLLDSGYQEVEINRDGEHLVIDVGQYSDLQEEGLLVTMKKLKRSNLKFGNIKLSPKYVQIR